MVYVKNRKNNSKQYKRSKQLNTTSKVKVKVMDKYDVIELVRGYIGLLFFIAWGIWSKRVHNQYFVDVFGF